MNHTAKPKHFKYLNRKAIKLLSLVEQRNINTSTGKKQQNFDFKYLEFYKMFAI